MDQEYRQMITSFARLGVLAGSASADPDSYAERIERWRTTTLFFLDVSRRDAHDPAKQANELRMPWHPAPAAYHELMNDLLLRAEKERRIIYVPDAIGLDDLFQRMRDFGWKIKPPEDTEILLVSLFQTFGWNHESATWGLKLAGKFVTL